MADIHSSSVIDPRAKIGEGVKIGPFCVVGGDVELAEGVQLLSHVVVEGRTKIGARTIIYPFASLGHRPQDLKYHGELSTLEIGSDNQIREHVTMNPGTEGGGMITRVGDRCLFMMNVHVAHDCHVGNNVVMANNATLAGHVTVGDFVVIGGLSGVLQFVRIGAHAMIGGMSAVENDVIPYGVVKGERAHLAGLNLIGLGRRNFAREDVNTLRTAYRMVFAPEGTMNERLDEVDRLYKEHALVQELLAFVRSRTDRGICVPRQEE